MEKRRFVDQTAVVTGGGQGIGRAVAAMLAREGAHVYIAEQDEEAGTECEGWIRETGGTATFVPTDVSQPDEIRRLMDRIYQEREKLHILCNNAGISLFRPLEELSVEEWDRVIHVNLRSAFLCVKYGLPLLRRAGQASIINIASTRALMSEPHTEAYSASKGGILALTHALAVSLGPTVRVNAICPGWIETSEWKKKSARKPAQLTEEDHRQHPSGRVGRPEDIARAVRYLASPDAEFITGANLVIDGGMTVKMIYA